MRAASRRPPASTYQPYSGNHYNARLTHEGFCFQVIEELRRDWRSWWDDLAARWHPADPYRPTDEFRRASPLYFVPHLSGPHLDLLRTRYIHFATGEGRWENIGESWALANVLGAQRIPNYVDSWGPETHHDWQTWRTMLPKYLGEWTQNASLSSVKSSFAR